MKYTVRVWAMGSYPEVDIDEEKFDELKKARNCLSGALAIEEKYELLISNYIDLEKECLDVSTDYMVRSTTDYGGFFHQSMGSDSIDCNRRGGKRGSWGQVFILALCVPTRKRGNEAKSKT